jgi:hypothetical protein
MDQPIAPEGNIVKDVDSFCLLKAFNLINIGVSNHRNLISCVNQCGKRVILHLTWKIFCSLFFLGLVEAFSLCQKFFLGGT